MKTASSQTPSFMDAVRCFGRLMLLAWPHVGRLARAALLGSAVNCLGLGIPYLTKLYVDSVYPTGDITLLQLLVGGVLAITIVTSVLGTLRSYYGSIVTQRLGNALSLMYFNHLQHLTPRFYDEHRVGEVMARCNGAKDAQGVISGVTQLLLVNGAYFLFVPPILFLLNWRLALLSLVTVPFTATVSALAGRLTRSLWKASAEAAADVNATQYEVLSQIRTVKALAAERATYVRLRGQIGSAMNLQLRAGAFSSIVVTVNGIIGALGVALYTYWAWALILRHEMTLGDYIAFTAYVALFTGPVSQAVTFLANFQQSAITLTRFFEYLDEPTEQAPEQVFTSQRPESLRVREGFTLRHVSVRYPGGRLALDDLSVDIAAGAVTAIVGESGAGKSTLLKALSRFLEPEAGSIHVDGVAIETLPITVLRSGVCAVWQDVTLIRGTFADNLAFGNAQEIPDERIAEVLATVRLDTLVQGLPRGLKTEVAEWGATLSGGQRQRLALARALLRDSTVLLLDEVTSQLDLHTEEHLLGALIRGRQGRTLVFVTHRPTTAALADKVCIVADGKMVDEGQHHELLARSEHYRSLTATQPDLAPLSRLHSLAVQV